MSDKAICTRCNDLHYVNGVRCHGCPGWHNRSVSDGTIPDLPAAGYEQNPERTAQ